MSTISKKIRLCILDDLKDHISELMLVYTGTELNNAILKAIDNAQEVEETQQSEWIDYDNTFYKCPDCGYLLEKCCPHCQNKVILPNN